MKEELADLISHPIYFQASLLASVPTMMAFPELSKVYGAWKEEVESRENVQVKTSTEVVSVDRSKKAQAQGGDILLNFRSVDDSGTPISSSQETQEVFDELILASDADSSLKILKAGSGPTWKEKSILGSVLYKWDVTVTHNDLDYMNKHYEMAFPENFKADRNDKESLEAFKFAKENWNPLYLIKMYEHDRKKIEMSFDLTVYQPQFKSKKESGGKYLEQRMGKENAELKEAQQSLKVLEKPTAKDGDQTPPPLEQHVFQTIFLDKQISEQWTKEEIKEEKVILER